LLLQFCLLLALTDAQASDLLKQGLLALQRGELPEARKDLEQASQVDPQNPYIWSSLAETYLGLEDREHAISAAKTAERLGGGNPVVAHSLALFYISAGDAANGLKFAKMAAEKRPSPTNLDLLGRSLILNGNTNEGIAKLGTGWQQAQTDPQIAFDYGDALLHQEEFTRAADVLSTALQAHHENAQLTLALGVSRYGQRRFEDAIALFLKTIELAPTATQPYRFLGKMLDQAGTQLTEITADFERWAAANPTSGAAQLLLAKALLVADPHSERALDLVRQSIVLDPGDWDAHYQLGVLLENRHDYQQSAAQLARAAEIDPNQPMPHYHLARVYDRLGESEKAKEQRDIHKRLTTPESK
jgi:tetratricopeptide (TPR) repeat protein